MSVWVCVPSARPVAQVNARMDKWRRMGYKVALWRDRGADCEGLLHDLLYEHQGTWPGVYAAWNDLIRMAGTVDPEAEWFVAGADDTDPDLNKRAYEIGFDCSRHFGHWFGDLLRGGSFGVMQPTGDRWGDRDGAYIDRVAGSPWIGREFARRVYGGRGPFCDQYRHMGGDEELQAVAQRLGVYWQRPDLIHYHDHWGRPTNGQIIGHKSNMPAFLAEANSPEHWRRYKALFAARKAAGFPGHEVIA